MFHAAEKYRVTHGHKMATDSSYGANGYFRISRGRTTLHLVVSDGEGWEHVSVHAESDGAERTPTWSEMCLVKDLFWDDSDCVVQYHPPKSEYVNLHKHTLHLWRQSNQNMVTPEILLV
jgi:hypothetical protein